MGASQLALDGRPLPPTWGRHRPAVTLLAATALSAGALLAAPAAAAAAAAATSAAPASIPAAVPAAALAAGAGLMVGTPPPRRAHRRNSPWVVPAEDPRAAWLAEDLSMDDELVAGGGRGGRGDPVAAGPRGLLTGAGRPLRLTMTASAGAGTATTTPPVEVATASGGIAGISTVLKRRSGWWGRREELGMTAGRGARGMQWGASLLACVLAFLFPHARKPPFTCRWTGA